MWVSILYDTQLKSLHVLIAQAIREGYTYFIFTKSPRPARIDVDAKVKRLTNP